MFAWYSFLRENYSYMRVIAEIPHPDVKITIFSWNQKYLVKLEKGPFEQTYKIGELDISGEDELMQMLDEPFIEQVLAQFSRMNQAWRAAITRAQGFWFV